MSSVYQNQDTTLDVSNDEFSCTYTSNWRSLHTLYSRDLCDAS
jgi:hypothetical protein